MFPFATKVYAMAPGAGGMGGDSTAVFAQFLPLILIFAIFWFLVIRPQQKRAKAHRQLIASIKKGDEVYTDSGIRGTIQKVAEDTVTLEIAPKVAIRVLRSRVSDLVKESKSVEPKSKEPKEGESENGA